MLFVFSPSLGRGSAEERSPLEYLDILYLAQSCGLYKPKVKNNVLSSPCSQSIFDMFSERAPGEVTVVTSNVALIQGAGRALCAQSCGIFRKCDIHWAECEVLLLSYTHIFYPYYQRERWWGHVLQQPWASTLGDSIDLQCLHSSSSWWWVSTKPPSLIRRNIGCSWSLAWEVLFFFLFFSVM